MVSNLRFLVMAGVVLGLLVIPAFSATVIATTTYNFDASDPAGTTTFRNQVNNPIANTTITGTSLSHLGSGNTDGVLGPFGNGAAGIVQNNQIVAMTITSPGPAFNAITLQFDLFVFNSWDGTGWTFEGVNYTADQFQVAVGGSNPSGSSCTGSALCTTFAQNYQGVVQNWGYAGTGPGRQGDGFIPSNLASRGPNGANYFSTPGFDSNYTFSGYDVYRINLGTINLGSSVTSVTVYFRGLFSGTLQTPGNDESWALTQVRYSALGPDSGEIPEPSTMILGGLGLALLALARMRSKKA